MTKSITEAGSLEGKRVLVRVDWSAPMEDGRVVEDFQIKRSLPTIEYLIAEGAEVTLATHLESTSDSIEPLKKYLPAGVKLLDNLRLDPREEANDPEYARELANLADIYVNEAFAVSHREHASIVSVPKLLPSYAGLNFIDEVEHLSKAFDPEHPFLLILGGAKFETKVSLVQKFLNIADHIFIGGTNAVPASKTELGSNPKISFPHGDIAALDVDDDTVKSLKLKVENSRLVVWNGPLGKYESGYTQGTEALAQILAKSSAETIVGGGDTLTAIGKLDLYDKFTFVSTGGGAMLDFLANETLPGIKALQFASEPEV